MVNQTPMKTRLAAIEAREDLPEAERQKLKDDMNRLYAERSDRIHTVKPGKPCGPCEWDYEQGHGISYAVDTPGRRLTGGRKPLHADTDELLGVYFAKLPQAKAFFQRPGVETWVIAPTHLVFAKGLGERFELDFPEPAA